MNMSAAKRCIFTGNFSTCLYTVKFFFCLFNLFVNVNINCLLTEREGRTGEYWPKVVTVRTERSEVRTKKTDGQYSPLRLEEARLVSSLLYGTLFLLVKGTACGLH